MHLPIRGGRLSSTVQDHGPRNPPHLVGEGIGPLQVPIHVHPAWVFFMCAGCPQGSGCAAGGTKQEHSPVDYSYTRLAQTTPRCSDLAARAAVNRPIAVCSPDTGREVESQACKEHGATYDIMPRLQSGVVDKLSAALIYLSLALRPPRSPRLSLSRGATRPCPPANPTITMADAPGRTIPPRRKKDIQPI